MPCYDSSTSPEEVRKATRAEIRVEMDALRSRLNAVTAILCELCREISSQKGTPLSHYSRRAAKWYAVHVELDRLHEAEEYLKRTGRPFPRRRERD